MARVLIGWEFGAGRGHVLAIVNLAAALEKEGHEVSLALQRPDLLTAEQRQGRGVWQAPLSPRMLVSGSRSAKGIPTTMGDILARLGMDEPAIVASQVRGWRQLFAAVGADLVIADFAPFLLLAARGRLPAILVGNGFLTPPADLPAFPALIGHSPAEDEPATLRSVNEGLGLADAGPIAALPEIFAADRRIPIIFTEFDPYAPQRQDPLASPLDPEFDAEAGEGEEIFVYLPETIDADSPLWLGLAAARLPVRVHVPRMRGELGERLAQDGFIVEPAPLPFAEIVRRSRLLLSHGGPGFLCAGAAAGLPHIVCHYDLEKLLNGVAVAKHGLGGHVALGSLEPKAFASSLVQLYRDEALAACARATARSIRERQQISPETAAIAAVAALA